MPAQVMIAEFDYGYNTDQLLPTDDLPHAPLQFMMAFFKSISGFIKRKEVISIAFDKALSERDISTADVPLQSFPVRDLNCMDPFKLDHNMTERFTLKSTTQFQLCCDKAYSIVREEAPVAAVMRRLLDREQYKDIMLTNEIVHLKE